MTAYRPVLMRAATVVQVLQDLFKVVLCFIACFILLVIAPLLDQNVYEENRTSLDEFSYCTRSERAYRMQSCVVLVTAA